MFRHQLNKWWVIEDSLYVLRFKGLSVSLYEFKPQYKNRRLKPPIAVLWLNLALLLVDRNSVAVFYRCLEDDQIRSE